MEYNKTDAFKQDIQPLVEKIKIFCSQNGIPMFMAFCVANDKEKSSYFYDTISPTVHEIDLIDDKFPKFLGVCAGCDVMIPVETPDISFDNFTPIDSSAFSNPNEEQQEGSTE